MRGLRRHRNKVKKAKYLRSHYAVKSDKAAGMYANHGCLCSCFLCGNPRRKWGRKTLKELSQDESWDCVGQ